jgi:hypothetical protein
VRVGGRSSLQEGWRSDLGLIGLPALKQCAGRWESKPTGGLESDLGINGRPAKSSVLVSRDHLVRRIGYESLGLKELVKHSQTEFVVRVEH